AERPAHGGELGAPTADAAEIAGEGRGQRRVGRAFLAQRREEQLVQDHRIGGDELLALEAVDGENRCRRKIERGELLRDGVQALHRAAVIVLVVADDELLRHSLDASRYVWQWLHFVGHWHSFRPHRNLRKEMQSLEERL